MSMYMMLGSDSFPNMTAITRIGKAFPDGYQSDVFTCNWDYNEYGYSNTCYVLYKGKEYVVRRGFHHTSVLDCNCEFEDVATRLVDQLIAEFYKEVTREYVLSNPNAICFLAEDSIYTVPGDKGPLMFLLQPRGFRLVSREDGTLEEKIIKFK